MLTKTSISITFPQNSSKPLTLTIQIWPVTDPEPFVLKLCRLLKRDVLAVTLQSNLTYIFFLPDE